MPRGRNIPKKSLILTYFLWLIGGLVGLHHLYLGRDSHAFVWWSTLGGFGLGWLADIYRIPRYVRDANEDPKYMSELVRRMLKNRKPPFSVNRFTSMLIIGYTWGQLMLMSIPPDDVWGIRLRYLHYLVPLATTLGVWTVGNIGRERGALHWPLLAAYAVYPVRFFVYDEIIWFSLVVFAPAIIFDSISKQWRRTPRKEHNIFRRTVVLLACAALYMGLGASYLYFHGTLTDSEGDEIPIYEALHNFFTSPWWLDVKQCAVDTWNFAQHHGWYEVWKQIVDLSDPRGEQNAYKVLGLTPEASQSELTSRWRQLSRENHPDKARPEQRRSAQERFMDIQRAYEILSSSKHRRARRNKRDNTVHSSTSPIVS